MTYKPTPEEIEAALDELLQNISKDKEAGYIRWWRARVEKALVAAHNVREESP